MTFKFTPASCQASEECMATTYSEFEMSVSLPVVSWNVWFGYPHQSARMDAIARLVADTRLTFTDRPVFIGMQELTAELALHLYPKMRANGYEILEQNLTENTWYGCAVAVRTSGGSGSFINASDSIAEMISSGFVPFSTTIMNRGFIWVHARVAQSKSTSTPVWKEVLVFTTTHLESPLSASYDGVKERAIQLLEIRDFCQEFLNNKPSVSLAMITGDLNWDDERYENSVESTETRDQPLLSSMGGGWIDAWLQHNTKETGITYDQVENPFLEGELKRRLDRVLLLPRKNPDGKTSLKSILHSQPIGKNVIQGLKSVKETRGGFGHTQEFPVLPSDHYGLVVNVML